MAKITKKRNSSGPDVDWMDIMIFGLGSVILEEVLMLLHFLTSLGYRSLQSCRWW